jgi:hypothetical protein
LRRTRATTLRPMAMIADVTPVQCRRSHVLWIGYHFGPARWLDAFNPEEANEPGGAGQACD